MADAVLVDSSFFIRRFREGRDPLLELLAGADDWDLATCGMVRLEVCRGLILPAVRRRYAQALAVMLYVPTDFAVWERAAALAWELDRAGRAIPASDLVIGACALAIDAPVFTFDRHFRLVPGLRVLDRLG